MDTFAGLDIPPRFWELVDAGQRNVARMGALLRELSKEDVARFYMEFRYATRDVDGRIDDLEDVPDWVDDEVVGWIVSQGRAFCQGIYDNLEELHKLQRGDVDYGCNFGGVALVVYEERFAEDCPPYTEPRWDAPQVGPAHE